MRTARTFTPQQLETMHQMSRYWDTVSIALWIHASEHEVYNALAELRDHQRRAA